MNKKFLLSVLSTVCVSGGMFIFSPSGISKTVQTSLNEIIPTSTNEKVLLKIGNEDKELSDLMKGYLKTITGAKLLSNIIASSMIVDFIDESNKDKTSALKDKLKNELNNLRNASNIDSLNAEDKKRNLKEFAEDANSYKNYQVLQKIQRKFIDVLRGFLHAANSKSDPSDLKDNDNADETIKSLNSFLDHALDDYIKVSKPLLIRKLTWKYDSANRKEDIEKLFEGEKLPNDFVVPEKGSYFFPFFSNETNEKFKKFLASSGTSNDFSEFSDEKDIHRIVSVGGAASPNNTSQFSIAILELAAHAMTANQWSDTSKGTKGTNLSNKIADNPEICPSDPSDPSANNKIPETSFDKAKDKALTEMFCLTKEKNPYAKEGQKISDFFYLKKNEKNTKPDNWIVFKDAHGVHAISVDTSVDDLNTKLKKELLKTDKGTDSNNKFKWDINKELGDHIEKHFLRLFLSKYEEITKKINSSGETTFKTLVGKLVKILESEVYSESIRSLRKNIFKDYASLLTKHPVNIDGKPKNNPDLGWAGHLPYAPTEQYLNEEKNNNKFKEYYLVFDFLEKVYLSDFKKLTADNLVFDNSFKDAVKDAVKDDFKTEVDGLFSSISSSAKDGYVFFTSSTPSTPSTEFKSLNALSVLNTVWNNSLQDGSFIEYLIQTEIKKTGKNKLKFFKWEENSKDFDETTNPFTNTRKEIFDNATTDLQKTIIKNYLLEKHLSKFVSDYDPNINNPNTSKMEFGDFTDITKALSLLKNIDKQDRGLFGSTSIDLIAKENVSLFLDMLTIKYLSDNNFENFRKFLKKQVSEDKISGIIFSRKFEKSGLCKANSKDKVLKFNDHKDKVWGINSKYLGYSGAMLDDFNCIHKSEFFNFSKAKLVKSDGQKETSFTDLVGYKGLHSADKLESIFPKEVIDQISSGKTIWKNNESLVEYLRKIKTHEVFEELISNLKKIFPSYDWSVAEQRRIIDYSHSSYNWNSPTSKKIDSRGEELDLEDRKMILSAFLSQNDKDKFKLNYSGSLLREVQENFLKNGISRDGKNSFLSNDMFKSFYGFVEDGKSGYLIKDKDDNEYVIFLIQVKYDDVVDKSSWTNFLKTMGDDLIIREVIKASKVKNLQNEAMYYYLQEDSTKLDKFTVYDARLREKLNFAWKNSEAQQ